MKIIRDTREKEGHYWDFPEIEVIDRKLAVGDYTTESLEGVLCIERKKSPSEIAMNIGIDSGRFNRELALMAKFEFAYILLEFSISSLLEFPKNAGLPKEVLKRIKINGKFLVKTLSGYKDRFGIEVLYCNSRDGAIDRALDILKTIESIKNE